MSLDPCTHAGNPDEISDFKHHCGNLEVSHQMEDLCLYLSLFLPLSQSLCNSAFLNKQTFKIQKLKSRYLNSRMVNL